MNGRGTLPSLFFLVLTCSTLANIKPKSHKNVTKGGQKRIDVQVNKWREAQIAINSLIDESIANEVTKAKKEVKALLEKNIVKHLREASRRAMQGKLAQQEAETDEQEEEEDGEELNDDEKGGVCQDEYDNCKSLASSGVCETSKAAMKKHCARTCDLCDDAEQNLPPATPLNKPEDDTWTIVGSDGERFTAGGIQQGIRKAAISSAQVQRLLKYVKQHAPHLTLKKIKPGVLKLVRIHEKKRPHSRRLKLKKHNYKNPKKVKHKDKVKHEDKEHDNYWTMKDDKESEKPKVEIKSKQHGDMLHFDLSNILKDKKEDLETSEVSILPKKIPKSEEYLKHICHPMCKKTCISSCAPGCCAGEHKQEFPLYHRKSSHCHPFCKKHCISSCPLTCCAETQKTSKTWRHPHVHHLTPGCHPMCKKNCVPSCPKACCAREPAKVKSHCHPLCKTNCLSSCPLSCCNHRDRLKDKCHPLCRKTCLPSCPDECCGKKRKERKLIIKSTPKENMDENKDDHKHRTTGNTCPALCPDSCAPACHSGCCNTKKGKNTHNNPIVHVTPSGCTANCVYECLPGCPPACCTRHMASTPQQTVIDSQVSPVVFPFSQPIMTAFAAPPPPQPVLPIYQQESNQPLYNSEAPSSSTGAESPAPSTDNGVHQQTETTSFFSPKHCPSSCLTHCSPECVRSDCCDLD